MKDYGLAWWVAPIAGAGRGMGEAIADGFAATYSYGHVMAAGGGYLPR